MVVQAPVRGFGVNPFMLTTRTRDLPADGRGAAGTRGGTARETAGKQVGSARPIR